MNQRRIRIEHAFAVPAERLWEVLVDHESMAKWLPARVTVLERRSAPPNGTESWGTVRRVRAALAVIDEQVTYFDPPSPATKGRGRMVYRIIRGAPFDFHRAEMLIEPTGQGSSQLSWDIVFAARIPLVARISGAVLEGSLRRGLRRLEGLITGV